MSIQDWLKEHPKYTAEWTRGKFLPGSKAVVKNYYQTPACCTKTILEHANQLGIIVARTKEASGAWGRKYAVVWTDGKKSILASWNLCRST